MESAKTCNHTDGNYDLGIWISGTVYNSSNLVHHWGVSSSGNWLSQLSLWFHNSWNIILALTVNGSSSNPSGSNTFAAILKTLLLVSWPCSALVSDTTFIKGKLIVSAFESRSRPRAFGLSIAVVFFSDQLQFIWVSGPLPEVHSCTSQELSWMTVIVLCVVILTSFRDDIVHVHGVLQVLCDPVILLLV